MLRNLEKGRNTSQNCTSSINYRRHYIVFQEREKNPTQCKYQEKKKDKKRQNK